MAKKRVYRKSSQHQKGTTNVTNYALFYMYLLKTQHVRVHQIKTKKKLRRLQKRQTFSILYYFSYGLKKQNKLFQTFEGSYKQQRHYEFELV